MLCVCSFQSNREDPEEDCRRRGGGSASCTDLANSELVAVAPSVVSGSSGAVTKTSGHSTTTQQTRKEAPTGKTETGCFSIIRKELENKQIQTESVELILQSWRTSTKKQYETYLRKWFEFSSIRKMDPLKPSVNSVLNFLCDLYKEGVKYSAIGTARSALSSFFAVYSEGKLDLGSNMLIKKFMKGVFNKRPSICKYVSTWDPEVVLRYISSLGSKLTLLQLSQKTCMLLLLLTAQRGQTIHLIRVEDIHLTEFQVEINFPHILKHSKPGNHQDKAVFKSFQTNKTLCIVTSLREYLNRTRVLRDVEQKLFISTQAPFKAVARATISRWVRTLMEKAGINVEKFKPHSTRAASTSSARDKGVPLKCIMKAAGWSQENTYRRFYDKPVKQTSEMQTALLSNLSG